MSQQIRMMDGNKRGLAYICLRCPETSPFVAERYRCVLHIYKKHVALDKAPFYCNICDFVCTNKRELHRHKERYPLHQHRVNEWKAQGKVFDEESKLISNPTPYKLTEEDLKPLDPLHTGMVWNSRKKPVQPTVAPALPTPSMLYQPVSTSNYYPTFQPHVPVPTYQPVPISTVVPSTSSLTTATANFPPPSLPDFSTATSTVVSGKSRCSTPNIGEDILQQILHDDNDEDTFGIFDDEGMTFLNSPEDTISTTLPPTTANNIYTTASTASPIPTSTATFIEPSSASAPSIELQFQILKNLTDCIQSLNTTLMTSLKTLNDDRTRQCNLLQEFNTNIKQQTTVFERMTSSLNSLRGQIKANAGASQYPTYRQWKERESQSENVLKSRENKENEKRIEKPRNDDKGSGRENERAEKRSKRDDDRENDRKRVRSEVVKSSNEK